MWFYAPVLTEPIKARQLVLLAHYDVNVFQMAEEARQKYDLDMASYRQAGFSQAQQGQVSTKNL